MATLGAFRSRDFRLLVAGQLISLTGTQMQRVAIAWQLYLLTHSPLSLGLLGLFRVLPVVTLALGGGVIADAVDRRRLMLASQVALALTSLVLALSTRAGTTTPLTIYAVTVAAAAAVAFESPARQALLPLLVPRQELSSALSLHAMAWQIAMILGPALGGVLIAWRGVGLVYFVDAASFLAVIAALVVMRQRAPGAGASGISLRAALDGLRFLRRTPLILWSMVLDFVATFFAGSLLLMPIFADQILGTGPRGLGLLYAAPAVGAAITAAALAVLPPVRRAGSALLISVTLYGAAIAAFGVSRWLWVSIFFLAISGAADTVSMVIRQTLRQLLTPDHLRGRMTSVNMIFFIGGPQLGEVEAGVVARAVGPRFSVTSGGLLCLAVALAAALWMPSLRRFTYPAEQSPPPLPPP